MTHQSLNLFKEVLPSIFKKQNTVIDNSSVDAGSELYPSRPVNSILSRSIETINLAVALNEIKHLPATASYEVARSFAPRRQPKFHFKDKTIQKTRVDELISILGVDKPTAELYDAVLTDEEVNELRNATYKGGIK